MSDLHLTVIKLTEAASRITTDAYVTHRVLLAATGGVRPLGWGNQPNYDEPPF